MILGKVAVAVARPVVLTWLAYGIFLYLTNKWGMTASGIFEHTNDLLCVFTLMLTMLLITNLVALGGFLIASRKTEIRGATLGSMLVAEVIMVLPLAGVCLGHKYQLSGVAWMVGGAVVLVLLNAILLLAGMRLFQREAILFKWRQPDPNGSLS